MTVLEDLLPRERLDPEGRVAAADLARACGTSEHTIRCDLAAAGQARVSDLHILHAAAKEARS